MKYEGRIVEQFGKWGKYFRPFIESDKFDEIFKVLKGRKGKVNTAPDSSDLFRAFATCDPDNLKVIFTGIAPYHTFVDKKPVADGLMMSCSKTNRLQPSLEQLYADFENTYNRFIDVDIIQDPNLEYLSKQGVLLYNVGLTVQEGKPCSDNPLWVEFDKFFWEEIINKYFRGIICVFMGTQCHRSASYLLPMVHYPFLISHPASASYNNTIWDSGGIWLQIDKILQQNNGVRIRWYKTKGVDDDQNLPDWVTKKSYEKSEINENETIGDLTWQKK